MNVGVASPGSLTLRSRYASARARLPVSARARLPVSAPFTAFLAEHHPQGVSSARPCLGQHPEPGRCW
jgi:hypothetical protein